MRGYVLLLAIGLCTLSRLDAQELPIPAVEVPNGSESTTTAVERWQVEVDYLYWFLHRVRVPALLTTGGDGSTGVLGTTGTELLYGDDRLKSRHDRYVGVRFDVDYWLDAESTTGIEVGGFFLERDSSNYTVGWQSQPLLARPFADANTGLQKALIIAGNVPAQGITLLPNTTGVPLSLTGGFNAYTRVEFFGQDTNFIHALAHGDSWHVKSLFGLRFLQMRERLDLTNVSRLLPEESTLISATDHFTTFNKYFGVQAGLEGEWHYGRWFVSGKAIVSIGGDDQEIRTRGDRVYQTPQIRQTFDYGLYVLPSNRGSFERGAFDFVSEVGINLGCDITRHMRFKVGYSLITWLNPVRPGDQVEPINLAQVTPGSTPFTGKSSVSFHEDFFWAQGVSAGLELRW